MILLDTCAIIWDAIDSGKLTSRTKKLIKQSEGQLLICDISIWEISMLIKKKRLVVDNSAAAFIKLLLQSRNYMVQEITPEIAELSVNFGPEMNNDPADRLIAATSVLANAPIVTADDNLRGSSLVETIW